MDTGTGGIPAVLTVLTLTDDDNARQWATVLSPLGCPSIWCHGDPYRLALKGPARD